MGVFAGPDIIEDGLVTLLDAGNSKSYSGSGTTWIDLSPNQQDATMNSAPSFTTVDNIKHFDFDGTDDYFEISNHYNMNITNAVTASCWVKSNTTNWNDTGWLMSKRNQFLLHPRTPNKQFDWYIHNGSFRPISVSNASFDITQWHNWTGTYDGSYQRLYLNGIQVNSNAQSGTLTSSTSSLFIGQDLGTRFGDAKIAYCMVYNKALTASEVKQNYEATKGRFGTL